MSDDNTPAGGRAMSDIGFTDAELDELENWEKYHDGGFIRAACDATPRLARALRSASARIRELESERANLVQNLCHNLPEGDYAAFCDGCDAYQRKLFGKCRSDTLREHPLPLFDIDVDSPEDSE